MKTWIITHFNTLLIATIAVFSPLKESLLAIGFLITMDFIFGNIKALIKKQKITSRKWTHTASKIFLYTGCVGSVYILDQYILKSGMNLHKIIAIFLGLIELKSILENFEEMTGINIWDRLIKIVKRGTSETKDLLDEIEDKKEDK